MKKKLFEAIARFYGDDSTDPIGHDNPFRVMLLPKGMLGADGMVVSEMIDGTIGRNTDKNLMYYFPEDTEESICNVIIDIFGSLEREGFNPQENYLSIMAVGITPPHPAKIRIFNINNYTVQYIFVQPYSCSGYNITGSNVVLLPSGGVIKSIFTECDSYITPAEFLYNFLSKYGKTNKFPNGGDIEKQFPALAEFVNSVEYYKDGGLRIDMDYETPEFGANIKTYTGEDETNFTVPRWSVFSASMIHLMYYNWCMRQMDGISSYRSTMLNHIINNIPFINKNLRKLITDISDVDPKCEDDIDSFEESNGNYQMALDQLNARTISDYEKNLEIALTEEFKIMQSNFKTICSNLAIINTKPATVGKLGGIAFKMPVPAIVVYEHDLDDILPYEKYIIRYIVNRAHIRTNTSILGDYSYMYSNPKNDISLGTVKGKYLQGISAFVKHDPTIGSAFILCEDNNMSSIITDSLPSGYLCVGNCTNISLGKNVELWISKPKTDSKK